jgi:phage regulator Rha-like protein
MHVSPQLAKRWEEAAEKELERVQEEAQAKRDLAEEFKKQAHELEEAVSRMVSRAHRNLSQAKARTLQVENYYALPWYRKLWETVRGRRP